MAIQRVSADTLGSTRKISVDDLTPLERQAAEGLGQIGPDGFTDIEAPVPVEMVDPKAEVRRKAIAAMTSVVAGAPALPPTLKVPEGNPDEYTKEIADLQEKLKTRSPCPRCGLGIHDVHTTKATPADIEEFLKCVLSATSFTKSYSLFGGKLKVTMATRSGATDDAVRRVITEKLRQRELLSETEVFALMRQLTLAAALREYVTLEATIKYPALDVKSITDFEKEARARTDGIPAHIQGFLNPIMNDFNTLVGFLTARAQDPDFWQGTPA